MVIAVSRRVLLSGLCVLAACSGQSADETAITDSMMRMFDKPEARLVVGPIAVAGNAALADWTQGAIGGRALLKRRNDEWSIELCAGDGIKNESALVMAGISADNARKIVAEINEEEQGEPADRLELIASFRGVVRMDASGAHPPMDSHAGHAAEADSSTAMPHADSALGDAKNHEGSSHP